MNRVYLDRIHKKRLKIKHLQTNERYVVGLRNMQPMWERMKCFELHTTTKDDNLKWFKQTSYKALTSC